MYPFPCLLFWGKKEKKKAMSLGFMMTIFY